ncbi:MAG: hypothetical protein WC374_02315 [Phycisphaerae bacterium]
MFAIKWATALQMLCLCALSAFAQPLRNEQQLFSPTAALAFYNLAEDVTGSGSEKSIVSDRQAEQALIFLTAATQLDNMADYVLPDMLRVACKTDSPLSLGLAEYYGKTVDPNDPNNIIEPKDNSQLVLALLQQYVRPDSDLQVAREAVQYLLGGLDSREQREQMLSVLIQQVGSRNDLLASELFTLLGMLAIEKADFPNAQNYFLNAINKNLYNRLAFDKLYELAGDQINPAGLLEHLRYLTTENPLDLQAALVFAQNTQQLQLFGMAVDAYAYTSQLYEYLYPNEPLPQYIYLPWALSAYSSQRDTHQALRIAEKVRLQGTFDIVLETVAAKAAEQTGAAESAVRILDEAEKTTLKEYRSQAQTVTARDLAWFYCFGKVDPANAIDWANKAYAAEPNDPTAAGLLSYAFVLNNEPNWARPFFENYQGIILDLAKAEVELNEPNNAPALAALKEIITAAPASLEARKAQQLLKQENSIYVPPADPEMILSVMQNTFGSNIVPAFRGPNEIFNAQLSIRGDQFAYGSDFQSSVIITNKSAEPLVISDYGLLTGKIRIDAIVTGDLNRTIPNLISKKIQPSQTIASGSTLIVPVNLYSGQLKEMLNRHPQASLNMEFTLYLDDATLPDGSVVNRLEDISPAVAKVSRPGINLTAQFLRNRITSLKRRSQSHNTAQLFIGLLIEQHIMAGNEPMYPYKYADWMPDMLKSGLVYNLENDDWPARVYTMQSMLDLPLDFELIEAVSQNLSDENWPVRMTALYLLAQNQTDDFGKVLDHVARYEQNKLVRDMAIALGGRKPPQNQ